MLGFHWMSDSESLAGSSKLCEFWISTWKCSLQVWTSALGGPLVRQGIQIAALVKWWLGRGKRGTFWLSFQNKWIYFKYYQQFTLLLLIKFPAVWVDKCTQKQIDPLLLAVLREVFQLVLRVSKLRNDRRAGSLEESIFSWLILFSWFLLSN